MVPTGQWFDSTLGDNMDDRDEIDDLADAIEAKIEGAIGRPLSEVDWWITDHTIQGRGLVVEEVLDSCEGLKPGVLYVLNERPCVTFKSTFGLGAVTNWNLETDRSLDPKS